MIKAGGADKVLHFGLKVTKQLQICISFRDEIIFEPTSAGEFVP